MTDYHKNSFPSDLDILFLNKLSHYSTSIGAVGQDFTWYADSYRTAFEVLTNHCRETLTDDQYLLLPIVYIFRHYIELRLKDILLSYFEVVGDREGFQKYLHHNIMSLWQAFREQWEYNGYSHKSEEIDFDNAERIIMEISKIDRDSFAFRYPIDKKNLKKPIDFQHIELVVFIETAEKLSRFLDAANDFVKNT